MGQMGFVLGCLKPEREALLKFKGSGIRDKSGHRLSSWTGEDCCSWKGVSCYIDSNHVFSLNLHNDFNHFPYLDPSLLELKELRYLDLSGNKFNGCGIPEFIGSMKFLRYLDLSWASFGGIIPPHLGNLTRLQHLDLSLNSKLRVTNLDWISSLVNLESLDISSLDFYDNEAKKSSLQALNTLPSLLDLRLSDLGIDNSLLPVIFHNSNFISTIQHIDLSFNFLDNPPPFYLDNMTSLTYLDLSRCSLGLKNSNNLPFFYNSSLPLRIQHLDLSHNSLEGKFPHLLYNLSSLRYLDLSFNKMNGSIPLYLRNNKEFVFLDLSYNFFSQVEEGTIMSILGNLRKLKYLSLSNNSLVEGEIFDLYEENFSECISFDLEHFSLSYNNIVSKFPFWLEKFGNLRVLSLGGGNKFHSPFPTYIGNLSLLEELHLESCGLKGRIPSSLGNLALLRKLDLSSNLLEGSISFIANLTSIRYLYLSFNPLNLTFSIEKSPKFQLIEFEMYSCKIEGQLPQWLKTQYKLRSLDLSNNAIKGELLEWTPNVNLRNLNLSNNQIDGKIPNFPLSSKIFFIDLSNNLFSGTLITSLCNLENLCLLNLKQNQLSGLIPDCWGQESSMFIVDLSFNKLSGTIPMTLGRLPILQYLKLNNNFIEGKIPPTFNVISEMIILDLGENKLTGEIPKWDRESCSALRIVRLRKNSLEGSLPSQLCSLPSLQILDLSNNNLTGSIPRCFSQLNHMKPHVPPKDLISYISPTNARKYTIEGDPVILQENAITLVLKGEELRYTKNLKYVMDLDLSCNGLVGSIPEELTNLSAFIGLNLSHNYLSGNIPVKIGEMKALESLDLSNNNLSGRIPISLGAITSLSTLNLSCNKLYGEIPTGSQLQTLNDPSIYGNNAGLCGAPLPSCETKQGKQKQEEEQEDNDDVEDNLKKVLFRLDVMLGLATGFWGVVGTLLINKKQRHAFFERVDDFGDYLYVLVVLRIKRFRN
ncbi:unnamed protein product [Amaranthus hypochondriacus]